MLADNTNKHLSIEGIGENAGFKSNSKFHQKFKSLEGLAPRQYRDNALKSNPRTE
jgi:transcriptional regulator GlxA family with amidase domain